MSKIREVITVTNIDVASERVGKFIAQVYKEVNKELKNQDLSAQLVSAFFSNSVEKE